ncbi:MAG: UDP-N-acetylglucosamine 2-epimerase (non-hydrolyzing) [Oscillospiraceae bacterium]|jgi:UDP-N-acetylglucosamine 2-epimerase|nr:UDP-N-acetylglucosamine 2-epimerase (non-hydrolyzing) [Oscillospiraceae bacterium]
MANIKVLSVFGTRPEAIKMAPVCRALSETGGIASVCCVTGQQRDLLPPMLAHFGIKPDYDLNIMGHNQTLTDITVNALTGLEPILREEKPDVLLCHGDTSTTLAAALAAFYQKIPVGHVEAGLRTYDRYSPYPEEMNRTVVSRLAMFHFCPTVQNKRNLEKEGVARHLYVTGNTVIDAISQTVAGDYDFSSPTLQEIVGRDGPIVLVTAHRRENYGIPLENICRAILDLTQKFPDLRVIWPEHPSPVVRGTIYPLVRGKPNIYLVGPLDVLQMHRLMAKCTFVMTDSGGLQEEAPALGKPVLVLRRETERPEAIEAGTAILAGIERERITKLACALIEDAGLYNKMASAVNPYGDGHASRRIISFLQWHFGRLAAPLDEFEVQA